MYCTVQSTYSRVSIWLISFTVFLTILKYRCLLQYIYSFLYRYNKSFYFCIYLRFSLNTVLQNVADKLTMTFFLRYIACTGTWYSIVIWVLVPSFLLPFTVKDRLGIHTVHIKVILTVNNHKWSRLFPVLLTENEPAFTVWHTRRGQTGLFAEISHHWLAKFAVALAETCGRRAGLQVMILIKYIATKI